MIKLSHTSHVLLRRATLGACALIFGASTFNLLAADPVPAVAAPTAKQVIDVRRALFTLIGSNFRPVGDTLQGKIPYNAADLQKRVARVVFLAPQPSEAFTKLDQTKTRADFIAAAKQLKALPDGNGKLGVVGFCYGGGVANYLATQLPDLAAAVPFYGAQPPVDTVAAIKAPLLLQYAEADERINAGWPAYETALKAAKVNYQAYIYPGVQHGFNNDTTPRYDAAAAKLAWERTIAFFEQHLRA